MTLPCYSFHRRLNLQPWDCGKIRKVNGAICHWNIIYIYIYCWARENLGKVLCSNISVCMNNITKRGVKDERNTFCFSREAIFTDQEFIAASLLNTLFLLVRIIDVNIGCLWTFFNLCFAYFILNFNWKSQHLIIFMLESHFPVILSS